MDFSNRSAQPQTVAPSTHVAQTTTPANGNGKKNKSGISKWTRIGVVSLFGTVALLLIFLVIWLIVGATNNKEDQYVDSGKLQAIFLSTGQVYFGNVKSMNNRYTVLTNIYYLQTASTDSTKAASTSSNVSLVKLGCELHSPYDQMVINRSQITFWENLQDSGQVATAVKTFEKDNPNGQKCADQSSSSNSNTSNAVQSATPTTTKP